MTFAFIFFTEDMIQGVIDFADLEIDIYINWINWKVINDQIS